MLRLIAAGLLVLAPTTTVALASTCNGADPAIQSVTVKTVNTSGNLNRYEIAGSVVNLGNSAQASGVLQFVDLYQTQQKLDAKGIPPLKPGQSYAFAFEYSRSIDAGNGTTHLRFQLDMQQPSPPGMQDCNLDNDRYTLSF